VDVRITLKYKYAEVVGAISISRRRNCDCGDHFTFYLDLSHPLSEALELLRATLSKSWILLGMCPADSSAHPSLPPPTITQSSPGYCTPRPRAKALQWSVSQLSQSSQSVSQSASQPVSQSASQSFSPSVLPA
jgi:hypothetical protein